jgi:hypothetical protein
MAALRQMLSRAYAGTPPHLVPIKFEVPPQLLSPLPPIPAASLGDDAGRVRFIRKNQVCVESLYFWRTV